MSGRARRHRLVKGLDILPTDILRAERAREAGPSEPAAIPAATPALPAGRSLGGRSAVIAARARRLASRRAEGPNHAPPDPVPVGGPEVPPDSAEVPAKVAPDSPPLPAEAASDTAPPPVVAAPDSAQAAEAASDATSLPVDDAPVSRALPVEATQKAAVAPRQLKHWRPWRRATAAAASAPTMPRAINRVVATAPPPDIARQAAGAAETSVFATLLLDTETRGVAATIPVPVPFPDPVPDPCAETPTAEAAPAGPVVADHIPAFVSAATMPESPGTDIAMVDDPAPPESSAAPIDPPAPEPVSRPSVFAELGPGMQFRLRQIGYGSDAALAEADPASLRAALGDISQLLNVEHWIAEAKRRRA